MSRQLGSWFAAAAIAATVAWTAPAHAADPKPASDAAAAEAAKAKADAQKEGQQTVDTILRQQEDLLSGRQFSYDPGGRRDPFRSLQEEAAMKFKGKPRPRGVAGMLVSELSLSGIVRDSSGGNIAVVMGSDNKGYFLRVGDEVYDGTVLSVDPSAGTVTFRQQVDDPRLIKPYRDVVKRLVPEGEEKANE